MVARRKNVIISVFSTTPGVGKTLTSINLSAGLAYDGYKVCLLDLDLQFGDVMNYLRLNSDRTIARAQRVFKNFSSTFNIRDFLVRYSYKQLNFYILPAPRLVHDSYQIEVATVMQFVDKYLQDFDFIVLDLNPMFSSLNLAMLDLSTLITYVGTIDFLPALKNFKVGYDALIRFEYEEQKIRLIENRAGSQKVIKSEDVERLLGGTFYHRLPNDFISANKSIEEGVPLMFSSPTSELSKSFLELASRYTNKYTIEPVREIEQQTSKGFFSRTLDALFG
ncbi:MAG: AAA family ATPase [Selenomonadaceae bacterium]|nr:AAA family ATPase [Selenomonadaceae bacterium]